MALPLFNRANDRSRADNLGHSLTLHGQVIRVRRCRSMRPSLSRDKSAGCLQRSYGPLLVAISLLAMLIYFYDQLSRHASLSSSSEAMVRCGPPQHPRSLVRELAQQSLNVALHTACSNIICAPQWSTNAPTESSSFSFHAAKLHNASVGRGERHAETSLHRTTHYYVDRYRKRLFGLPHRFTSGRQHLMCASLAGMSHVSTK